MAKLSKFIHWPSFAAAVAVYCVGGFVTYKWTSLGFWTGFCLTAFGMIVIGWIATYEDEQPSGFNNPVADEDKQRSSGDSILN